MEENTNESRGPFSAEPAMLPGLNLPKKITGKAYDGMRKALVIRDLSEKLFVLIWGSGIRRRLLIWCLSIFGIALTAVIIAGYFYTVKVIEHDAATFQAELASVTAARTRSFVRRKIQRFSDIADAVSLYPLGSKEQQLLLGLLVKNDNSFTEASIMDARGIEVIKVSDRTVFFPADLSDQSKSENFIKAIKGRDYISAVYTSPKAQPYVTVAIPLWGAAHRIVGVASAEADLSFLWDIIGKMQFGAAGYAYLVDKRGNLIAHKDAPLVLKKLNLRRVDGVERFLRNPMRSDPNPAHRGRGLLDKEVLTTYAPIPDLGWGVILEEPLDAALIDVDLLKHAALALLIMALAVGTAVIIWVSGRITGPIRNLHEGAKTIGSGNLDYRVDINTGDEIEWLGEEFNKMADQLKVFYSTLEKQVSEKTAELAKTNSELEQVNQNLLKANQAKDEFLHVMSHELRTPLNVLFGYSQLLKDGSLGPINREQEHALTKVMSRAKDLTDLIGEILSAANIQAGKISADIHTVHMGDFMDDLKSNYDIPLDKKLTFQWNYPSEPWTIETDGDKLKHILQNLINNAIKFTDEGSISVTARHFSETKVAKFKVADTGIGIKRELLPSIFEMFHQLDSSETRAKGGVGLGLYIVRKYTQALGGRIQVNSQPGKGSVFTVTIPC